MLEIIAEHSLIGHAYADDTQTYEHCSVDDLPITFSHLQHCFSALFDWMNSNRLKLNADKTEVIIFGSRHKLSKVELNSITLNGVVVPLADSVRNLGVTLESDLSFTLHSKKLTSSCFFNIKQCWQIRNCLTQPACETLVHAFVTSRLDYCNAVLAGSNKSVLRSLQLIQNAAARLVTRSKK